MLLYPRPFGALGIKTGPPAVPVGSETQFPDRDIEGAATAAPFVFGANQSFS